MSHCALSVLSNPGTISLQDGALLRLNVKLTLYTRSPVDSISNASVSGFEFSMVGCIATPSEDNGVRVTLKV